MAEILVRNKSIEVASDSESRDSLNIGREGECDPYSIESFKELFVASLGKKARKKFEMRPVPEQDEIIHEQEREVSTKEANRKLDEVERFLALGLEAAKASGGDQLTVPYFPLLDRLSVDTEKRFRDGLGIILQQNFGIKPELREAFLGDESNSQNRMSSSICIGSFEITKIPHCLGDDSNGDSASLYNSNQKPGLNGIIGMNYQFSYVNASEDREFASQEPEVYIEYSVLPLDA